jgi:hypothetical protein
VTLRVALSGALGHFRGGGLGAIVGMIGCSGAARYYIVRRRARASRPRARLANQISYDDGCSDKQNRCTGPHGAPAAQLNSFRSLTRVAPSWNHGGCMYSQRLALKSP